MIVKSGLTMGMLPEAMGVRLLFWLEAMLGH